MKVKSESEVARSCPTLCNPMDCSPPGSSIHGIFQARVLEWGAIAFSQKCSEVTFIKVLIVYHNHGLLLGHMVVFIPSCCCCCCFKEFTYHLQIQTEMKESGENHYTIQA